MGHRRSPCFVQMCVPTMRSAQVRNGLRVKVAGTCGGDADLDFGDGKCAGG